MKKKIFGTRTLVATALGAVLFFILFYFVKVPTPVPDTNLQFAYAIAGAFGAIFGPICSFLVAFIGHGLNDFIGYGAPWWSWVIASGVCGLISGISYFLFDINKGEFGGKEIAKFSLCAVVANVVSWILVAPLLDILIYAEPAKKSFAQGGVAAIVNTIAEIVVGIILLKAYSSTKTKTGSLKEED